MGKSGVGVFFLFGEVVVLLLLSATLPSSSPTSFSIQVEPTAECQLAIETLRQNRQGLINTAYDSRRDVLIVLEENRWILEPLKAEVTNLCK